MVWAQGSQRVSLDCLTEWFALAVPICRDFRTKPICTSNDYQLQRMGGTHCGLATDAGTATTKPWAFFEQVNIKGRKYHV